MITILIIFCLLTYLLHAKNMRDYSEVALWWLCLMSYKGNDKNLAKFREMSPTERQELSEKFSNKSVMSKVYPKVSRYNILLMLVILACVGALGYLSLSNYSIIMGLIVVVVGVFVSVFIASVTSGFARGNLWIQDIETGITTEAIVADKVSKRLRLSDAEIKQFDVRLDSALKKYT